MRHGIDMFYSILRHFYILRVSEICLLGVIIIFILAYNTKLNNQIGITCKM